MIFRFIWVCYGSVKWGYWLLVEDPLVVGWRGCRQWLLLTRREKDTTKKKACGDSVVCADKVVVYGEDQQRGRKVREREREREYD